MVNVKINAIIAMTIAFVLSAAPARAAEPTGIALTPLPAGAETRPVSLATTVFGLDRGQTWGRYDYGVCGLAKHPLIWEKPSDAVMRGVQDGFRREVTAAGFKLSGDSRELFDTSTSEYTVGALVTAMDANLCSPLSLRGTLGEDWKGAISVKVEWQIYSQLERRTVARVTTTGIAEQTELRPDAVALLVTKAFAQNTRALINSAEFRSAFIGATRRPNELVEASGSQPIAIRTATGPTSISDSVGSVVAVFSGSGMGSGLLVGVDGEILTNSHVVGDAKTVRVRWSDGFETEGQVMRSDRRRDVALIRTNPHGRLPLALAPAPPQVGAAVYAVGVPLDQKFQGTVTKGIVSANRILDGFNFIQADVTVNPGSSGGPLLNEKAQVVGMTVAGFQPDGTPTGINLFIPIKDAVDFLALKLN